VEKAAELDRDTYGVAVGQGPWQRRPEEIGGIKPLAFGQFGEVGPGLEALLARMAKRGADEMWRIDISSKTARRQLGCRCSTCGSAGGLRFGGRKRRSSLVLGRLKYALPGWEVPESRRAADTSTEAS
jgi:hypothetical protein